MLVSCHATGSRTVSKTSSAGALEDAANDAEARDAFEEPRFLESHELDALYQCTDVSVMELKRK